MTDNLPTDLAALASDMEESAAYGGYSIEAREAYADCAKQIRSLASRAGGGWLPIESAPKDGSMFLCWVDAIRYGEDDEGRAIEADVSAMDFCEWRDMGDGDGFWMPYASPHGDGELVSHWMPIAAPLPPAVGVGS